VVVLIHRLFRLLPWAAGLRLHYPHDQLPDPPALAFGQPQVLSVHLTEKLVQRIAGAIGVCSVYFGGGGFEEVGEGAGCFSKGDQNGVPSS
jgi:hypothetical protein